MSFSPSRLRAVRERIVAHETSARLGRRLAVELPTETPPLTILAGRAFPADVLDRRLRFLEQVGWLADVPEHATIEDCLAAIRAAPTFRAEDEETAALALSIGATLNGPPPRCEPAYWDAFFDGVADRETPGWRLGPPPAAVTARFESVTLRGDSFFGRHRAVPFWPATAAVLGRIGDAKRRWFG